MKVQQREPVKLEEALGAFDLFISSDSNLGDIRRELDRIAQCVKDGYTNEHQDFDHLTIREKAFQVGQYLRSKRFADSVSSYALQNHFMVTALLHKTHSSCPLQPIAVYCAVCERLGVDAQPCGTPKRVIAMIRAPLGQNVDGTGEEEPHRPPLSSSSTAITTNTEVIYIDPLESNDEILRDDLLQIFHQIGRPPTSSEYTIHLKPITTFDIVLYTAWNLHGSIDQILEGQALLQSDLELDLYLAKYTILWARLCLGAEFWLRVGSGNDQDIFRLGELNDLRYEHELEFSQDAVSLLAGREEFLFPNSKTDRDELTCLIQTLRADPETIHPRYRDKNDENSMEVLFYHRRYDFAAFIIGWDRRCADQRWGEPIGTEEIPGDTEQPFYRVMYVCSFHYHVNKPYKAFIFLLSIFHIEIYICVYS